MRLSPNKIVIIDDEADDVFLAKTALKKIQCPENIIWLKNVEEAIDFLINRKEVNGEKFGSYIKLVLLDLHMPKVDGKEVLKAIRGNKETSTLTVVIVADSGKDINIKRAKELVANSYIVKPFSAVSFMKVINEMGNYWINVDEF